MSFLFIIHVNSRHELQGFGLQSALQFTDGGVESVGETSFSVSSSESTISDTSFLLLLVIVKLNRNTASAVIVMILGTWRA